MKRFLWLAAFSAVTLAPGAGWGQEDEGRTSLSLAPFGGTAIGLWHRVSPRVELGVEAGAMVRSAETDPGGTAEEQTQEQITLFVEPAARLYGGADGPLRPYTMGSVFYRRIRGEVADMYEAAGNALGASVGLGLEWSPARRVRIGGHAGVQGSLFREESTQLNTPEPISHESRGWDASTFNSGLTFYYTF